MGSCQTRRTSSKYKIMLQLSVHTSCVLIYARLSLSLQATTTLSMDDIQVVESKPLLADKDLQVCVLFL